MSKESARLIVRILGKDLNGTLPIYRSLMDIKGVSHRMARAIASVFEREQGISFDSLLGELPEEMDKKLEEIISKPEMHGIPRWMLNRRSDVGTGEDLHLSMNDLDFSLRKDLERMKKIKSYKGVRHSSGLPVRGQRTRSSFRQRGATVGVVKKEAKAAGAAKKEEKK